MKYLINLCCGPSYVEEKANTQLAPPGNIGKVESELLS